MLNEVSFPSLIAEATRLAGDITFYSVAHVFGDVEGDVVQLGLEPLQVGKSGAVKGNIRSHGPVIIEGRVDGNIVSATRIFLLSTAVVHGNLTAPSVRIRAGAVFEGELAMSVESSKALVKAAA